MRAIHFRLLCNGGVLALVLSAIGTCSFAGDWPQILGPNRDGVSTETGLLKSWPDKGPRLVWEKDIGEGYSAPVVSGDTVVILHRIGDEEVVEALDAANGKQRWKFAYPTTYTDALGKGNGPRATPVIARGHVYALGAEGQLHCLELKDGKKVWEKSLAKDYEMRQSYFGVGSSPLLEEGRLIINVGAKDAGIVAFDKDTGKEVWKATDHEASYSSPTAATLDGVRHVFFLTREGFVDLDPKDGKVRTSQHWRSRTDASVNAATPLVFDGQVFVTASYATGALLLRIGKDRTDEVWKGDKSLSCHYNTPVHAGDYLYGIHGRQEQGASLRCVDAKTGKVKWEKENFGCAALLLVDGHIIALTEGGELVLLEASADAYREKSRAAVFKATPCRAEIALAEGRLFARDGKRLACWNVRK